MAKSLGDLQKLLIDVERAYTPPDGKLTPEFWTNVDSTIRNTLANKVQSDVTNRISSLSISELTQLRALVAELRDKGVLQPIPEPEPPPAPVAAAEPEAPKKRGPKPKAQPKE